MHVYISLNSVQISFQCTSYALIFVILYTHDFDIQNELQNIDSQQILAHTYVSIYVSKVGTRMTWTSKAAFSFSELQKR